MYLLLPSIDIFCLKNNQLFCIFRWGTHLYMPLCPFVRPSVLPSRGWGLNFFCMKQLSSVLYRKFWKLSVLCRKSLKLSMLCRKSLELSVLCRKFLKLSVLCRKSLKLSVLCRKFWKCKCKCVVQQKLSVLCRKNSIGYLSPPIDLTQGWQCPTYFALARFFRYSC